MQRIIKWSINLFNFMDGIEGLAGTEALMLFGMGGILCCWHGATTLALMVWWIAALVAGFLIWNWPKASVFMSDASSIFVEYLVARFAFASEGWHHVPALFWMMLYPVFYFDATVTLLRRFLAKHVLFEPHRLHAFQRLLQAGWRNRPILYGLIIINLILIGLVIYSDFHPSFLPYAFAASVSLILFIYLGIERLKPMH